MSESGDIDNSELWTNSERDLATKAVGLVKVTLLCLQRLQKTVKDFGSCVSPEYCKELDQVVEVVRTVSPSLDDFVSELYHPVDVPCVIENSGKLVGVLRQLLSIAKNKHFAEGIVKDMDRLLLFISHNHCKLDPNLTNPVPEINSLVLNS